MQNVQPYNILCGDIFFYAPTCLGFKSTLPFYSFMLKKILQNWLETEGVDRAYFWSLKYKYFEIT